VTPGPFGRTVAALVALIAWACGSNSVTGPSTSPQVSSSPTPTPTPAPTPAPAAPAAIAFRVTGVVTNDEGAPLDDAMVVLTYQPDLAATQTVNTRTGVDGRYELRLNAQQPGNVSALIRATASAEFRSTEQLVRVADNAEKNFRLRSVRSITVGQATVLKFDSESSLCASVGIAGLCEWVRIQYPSTFTSRLTVRADTGSVVPTLRAFVPPTYTSIGALTLVVGQGSVTFPAGDDEYRALYSPRTADVVLTIPTEAAPQRIEVTVFRED
jgi:hypothetical protein